MILFLVKTEKVIFASRSIFVSRSKDNMSIRARQLNNKARERNRQINWQSDRHKSVLKAGQTEICKFNNNYFDFEKKTFEIKRQQTTNEDIFFICITFFIWKYFRLFSFKLKQTKNRLGKLQNSFFLVTRPLRGGGVRAGPLFGTFF